jgi:hypothetical protein
MKTEIFLKMGLDRNLLICPSGKVGVPRTRCIAPRDATGSRESAPDDERNFARAVMTGSVCPGAIHVLLHLRKSWMAGTSAAMTTIEPPS